MGPVACIITSYCGSTTKTITLTTVWWKILIVHATKMHVFKFQLGIPREYRMIAALQWRKLNMFKWREGMLSPRAFVRGNPARVKFAAENNGVPLCITGEGSRPYIQTSYMHAVLSQGLVKCRKYEISVTTARSGNWITWSRWKLTKFPLIHTGIGRVRGPLSGLVLSPTTLV